MQEEERKEKKKEWRKIESPRNYGDTSKHTNIMEPSKGERRNILIAEKFSNIMKNSQNCAFKKFNEIRVRSIQSSQNIERERHESSKKEKSPR